MTWPYANDTGTIRTLGIIGDVHGRHDLLARAIRALEAADLDIIVCVGDICGPGDGVDACCRMLASRRILTVRGNHDRWFLAAAEARGPLQQSLDAPLQFLRGLPVTAEIHTQMGVALLCHGLGTNDLARLPRTFAQTFIARALRLGHLSASHRLVVHGHSHESVHLRQGDILFVNPGALGSGTGGCLVLDTREQSVAPLPY